jgi:hypothetical protein
MRISIDTLPPIHNLLGTLRVNDCFICAWCIFSSCSIIQRTELTAAAKNGIKNGKIINALNRLEPDYIWSWEHGIGTLPESVLPSQAAIILYRYIDGPGWHYSILIHLDTTYALYDPQQKTATIYDHTLYEYMILNAHSKETGELHIGKLPPNELAYESLANKPTAQAKENQTLYLITAYLKRLKLLFKDKSMFHENLEEMQQIQDIIHEINELRLNGRHQKRARRQLNDEYMKIYRSLLKIMPDATEYALNNPLKLKSTNSWTHIWSQKPTKTTFTKSKHDSARMRKAKRKTRKIMSIIQEDAD